MMNETFLIDGMTCASCAQTIEGAVQKMKGVQSVSVNLATEKMQVAFDGATISESKKTQV